MDNFLILQPFMAERNVERMVTVRCGGQWLQQYDVIQAKSSLSSHDPCVTITSLNCYWDLKLWTCLLLDFVNGCSIL